MNENTRNVFVVVGGSIGLSLVLAGSFFLLCVLSWTLMWAMDWALMQLGHTPVFGGEQGPMGLETLIGAFLLLSLRRLTRIERPED